MLKLCYQTPVGAEEVVTVEASSFAIGRADDNDLVLEDLRISRRHAIIKYESGAYTLRDLESTNGTFLNGGRVGSQGRLLQHLDRIELCWPPFLKLRVEMTGEGATVKTGSRPLQVDETTREVTIRGKPLERFVSGKQFDILAFLWNRWGQVCSLQEIERVGWPNRQGPVNQGRIHTFMHRISRRLRENGLEEPLIQTVRGIGYRMGTVSSAENDPDPEQAQDPGLRNGHRAQTEDPALPGQRSLAWPDHDTNGASAPTTILNGALPLEVDLATRQVRVCGEPLRPPLAPKQFSLLAYLWSRPGQACSLREIAEACWPEEQRPVNKEQIQTLVHRIRQSIQANGVEEPMLENVRQYGYKLRI